MTEFKDAIKWYALMLIPVVGMAPMYEYQAARAAVLIYALVGGGLVGLYYHTKMMPIQ